MSERSYHGATSRSPSLLRRLWPKRMLGLIVDININVSGLACTDVIDGDESEWVFLVREFSRYTNHTLIIITKKTIHHFLRIISSKSFLHLDILVAQLIESENLQFLVTSHDGNSIRPFIRKEGNVLFNDALNTFYLRLYGVRHMVKDHFDSEKGNPLPPHRLLFPINSKGSFICTIPDRIVHTTAFVTPVVEHWLER